MSKNTLSGHQSAACVLKGKWNLKATAQKIMNKSELYTVFLMTK
jgi:hypothetical protein